MRQRREGLIMTMKHQWKQLKYSGTSTVTAVEGGTGGLDKPSFN